jgi:hypothetical protein
MEKMASEISCVASFGNTAVKIATNRASPLPQITLHRYWNANFGVWNIGLLLSSKFCSLLQQYKYKVVHVSYCPRLSFFQEGNGLNFDLI